MASCSGDYGVDGASPAPFAQVELADPVSCVAQDGVIMLLDSGADVTVLPPWAAEKIGLRPDPVKRLEVSSYDGRQSVRAVVQAKMRLGTFVFRIECILHDEDQVAGVIGRDVLNHLCLTLDGPERRWTLSR
jgi:predicted aspartyl protease